MNVGTFLLFLLAGTAFASEIVCFDGNCEEIAATKQVVILGGTGDLAVRKLFPALFQEWLQGERVQVVGSSRTEMTSTQFREFLTSRVKSAKHPAWLSFVDNNVHYSKLDIGAGEFGDFQKFLETLVQDETKVVRILYLSVAPSLFLNAVQGFHKVGGLKQDERSAIRVVCEKPFGWDAKSARELNEGLLALLEESQLYRIDHYLGKAPVQNLMTLRFENSIFRALWNKENIRMVEISVLEDLGMEGGRGGYYDSSGAIRDMLQNHLLQMLSLVAMDTPVSWSPDHVRDAKVAVLRNLRPVTPSDVVRAQYQGYLEEEKVPKDSKTETYFAVRTKINSERWGNVNFFLRHGKKLGGKHATVVVHFQSSCNSTHNDFVAIEIQPEPRVYASLSVIDPETGGVSHSQLEWKYAALGKEIPDAYQSLIHKIVEGDQSSFVRNDEVDASWAWTDALKEVLETCPLHVYQPLSFGPDVAGDLFSECEKGWLENWYNK